MCNANTFNKLVVKFHRFERPLEIVLQEIGRAINPTKYKQEKYELAIVYPSKNMYFVNQIHLYLGKWLSEEILCTSEITKA